jgi:hypothetical protein
MTQMPTILNQQLSAVDLLNLRVSPHKPRILDKFMQKLRDLYWSRIDNMKIFNAKAQRNKDAEVFPKALRLLPLCIFALSSFSNS